MMAEQDPSREQNDDLSYRSESLSRQTAQPRSSVRADQVRLAAVSRTEYYQGLLPHPDLLQRFDEIVPGAAEKIFNTFEKQAHHRMQLEHYVITHGEWRAWAGLGVATVVAIGGLAMAGFLVYTGHDIAGSVLGGGILVSLVAVFIYGTNSRRQERAEKVRALTEREE